MMISDDPVGGSSSSADERFAEELVQHSRETLLSPSPSPGDANLVLPIHASTTNNHEQISIQPRALVNVSGSNSDLWAQTEITQQMRVRVGILPAATSGQSWNHDEDTVLAYIHDFCIHKIRNDGKARGLAYNLVEKWYNYYALYRKLESDDRQLFSRNKAMLQERIKYMKTKKVWTK
jgi:hypothetical protein